MTKDEKHEMALRIVSNYYTNSKLNSIEEFTDHYIDGYKKIIQKLNEEFSSGGTDFLK